MKVLFFTEAYLPSAGGVEIAVANVAKVLLRRGHQAVVVTDRPSPGLPAMEVLDGIPVYRVGLHAPTTRVSLHPQVLARFWYRLLLAPLLMPVTLLRLLFILRRERPDVVNVHYVGRNALYALILKRLARFKLAVSVVGFDLQRYPTASWPARLFIRMVLREADRVLAYTRHQLTQVEEIVPGLLSKAGTVGQGIDPEEFTGCTAYRHPRPYLLAIGNFRRRKGLDLLVRAFALVRREHPALDLILAGEGEERPACEELARQLEVADAVLFFGRAGRKHIGELLKGCEFLVLPSRQEAFGMVILEAMVAGKTVVATRVGGVPEVVTHEQNGLLVEPESPEALAEGVRTLLLDQPLRDFLARAGAATVQEQYTWDRVTDRYLMNYLAEAARGDRA